MRICRVSLTYLATLSILVFIPLKLAYAFSLDSGFLGEPNNNVSAIAKQLDGKILVAGDFTSINGTSVNRLARLLNDGSPDPSFVFSSSGVNGLVRDIAVQQDGKIIVVGSFTSIAGVSRFRIARLNADGSLDTAFDTAGNLGANNSIARVRIQSDGKLVIAGLFTQFANQTVGRIARLNNNGSLDATFASGAGFNGFISAMDLDYQDKIAVSGGFSTYDGQVFSRLAVLDKDGRPDSGFDPGASTGGFTLNAIQYQVDGKLIIGGAFSSFNGTSVNRIARLNPDASIDTTFSSPGNSNGEVDHIALLDDGRIFVAGNFVSFGGSLRRKVAILNRDGSTNQDFDIGNMVTSGEVYLGLERSDGSIVFGGSHIANGTTNFLTQVDASGQVNLGSTPSFNGEVKTIAQQPDGKLVVGGVFSTLNGSVANKVVRLNTDGSRDTGFNATVFNTSSNIIASAIQVDGKILVGGEFSTANSEGIIRLEADGSIDTDFLATGVPTGAAVRTIALQPDGKILIGGTFSSVNAAAANRIARLMPDGSLDTSFSAIIAGLVEVINVQPDGSILLGGEFLSVNGSNAYQRVAKLKPDGALDTTFLGRANDRVFSISTLAGGKLMISGAFSTYNLFARPRIVRTLVSGAPDGGFSNSTSIGNTIFSANTYANGKILVGGAFSSLAGQARNARLGRLNINGAIDSNYQPSTSGANDVVKAALISQSGSTVVGGNFTQINGQNRTRFAKVTHPDEPVAMNLDVDIEEASAVYQRKGAAPLLNWLTYEVSTDATTWSDPKTAARENGDWKLSDLALVPSSLNYIRLRGTVGGSRATSGSLFEKVYQVFDPSSPPEEDCSFFILRTSSDNIATICL